MAAQCSAAIIMLTALITKETIWDKSCQGRPKWPKRKTNRKKVKKCPRQSWGFWISYCCCIKLENLEMQKAILLNWGPVSPGEHLEQFCTWNDTAGCKKKIGMILGMIQMAVKTKLEWYSDTVSPGEHLEHPNFSQSCTWNGTTGCKKKIASQETQSTRMVKKALKTVFFFFIGPW